MLRHIVLTIGLVFIASSVGFAQSSAPQAADLAGGVEFRNLTPAMTGGRISKVVKDYTDPSVWYVGVSSGGVWKTENNGTTWNPIFQNQGSYSIGTIAIDPVDPNVIWVGTGENNSQRSVGYGDGIYKSLDGGKTWRNMGLESSNHIGKIVIDPRNTNTVYVAAQGPLWSPGGERGLYRTTDGGETWKRILHISKDTGISDVVMDPSNPDILYSASYQRRRHFGILVAGGPEGAIYKSTDGGNNWKKLLRGLPSGVDIGRIGLAVSPQKPEVVYAIIAAEGNSGGFFRSEDRGETWTKMSDHMVVDAQYYMELFPSPHQFDKVYAVDVRTHYTEDGGATWKRLSEENKHVDNHDIVFDPDDPEYMMLSNDGGIYETWDNAKTWKFIDNLPITQFYRVGIDNSKPFYYVYGGTQDNSTLGAPNQTIKRQGIMNDDWFYTKGGDGFQTRVDPENPDILYSMSQYGDIVRFDRKSGQQVDIQPQPDEGGEALRWHWNSPLIISPHKSSRLYFAANKLFRSDDRGNSWEAVSGDLTLQLNRNEMEVMGRVWSPEAVFKNVYTSPLSTIVALDESPLEEGLIYAGTDDGMIQVTENGGDSWRKIDRFPGVPRRAFVSDVFASPVNRDQVFAVFNNYKYGDYEPYVLVSNDRGRSWESISNNLPDNEFGWSIYQDHENPEILFLGTEFGLQFSLDGGRSWTEFRDVPTIQVRDIEIHEGEDDLILATFGLGFYILDDYSFMRHLSQDNLSEEAYVFPVKETLQFIPSSPHSGSRGHSYFSSPNPPYGAVITYYLKESIPTLKQQRKREEDRRIREDERIDYPAWEKLEKEDRQERPFVVLTVTDVQGNLVTRIRQTARSGLHRVAWDMRSDPVGSGSGWRSTRPLVSPGEYQVSVSKVVNGEWTTVGNTQKIKVKPLDNVTLPSEDRKALAEFQHKVIRLNARVDHAEENLDQALGKLDVLKQAIAEHGRGTAGYPRAEEIRMRLLDLREVLDGDVTKTSRAELTPPAIIDRVNTAMGSVRSTSDPTGTQKHSYELARRQFEKFISDLNSVLKQLDELEQKLKEEGIVID